MAVRTASFALTVAAVVLVGCGLGEGPESPERAGGGPVVARVGEAEIGVSELGPGEYEDVAERERRLEVVIARKLAAREARRRDLAATLSDQIAGIRRQARLAEEELLRDALFDHVRTSLELSPAELRAHYEQTKHRYGTPQVRVRVARFDSKGEVDEARARLEAGASLAGGAFESVGPMPVGDLPAELLPEAARLREPGRHVVLERDGSWLLVELAERLAAAPRAYEAVRARVEDSLRTLRGQEAFRELVAELRRREGVEIVESVLVDDALWVPRRASGEDAGTGDGTGEGASREVSTR